MITRTGEGFVEFGAEDIGEVVDACIPLGPKAHYADAYRTAWVNAQVCLAEGDGGYALCIQIGGAVYALHTTGDEARAVVYLS